MSRPLSSRLAIAAKKVLRRRLRRSPLIRFKVRHKPEVLGMIDGSLTISFLAVPSSRKLGILSAESILVDFNRHFQLGHYRPRSLCQPGANNAKSCDKPSIPSKQRLVHNVKFGSPCERLDGVFVFEPDVLPLQYSIAKSNS
ncbi:hypothetical protein N7499_008738 [Penicillium canescens]|nr:hypothetical protein N7499_008738 [Penicillium canescens]KAJ6159067.1 hypothetical protein N7485_011893 [Penicillium canescens]